ncbi:MAG: hypothetical protein K2X74_00470 [Acetobacteraceae bacterium]|nr:hypothetical protein [Acetobacteraceae bacterium]
MSESNAAKAEPAAPAPTNPAATAATSAPPAADWSASLPEDLRPIVTAKGWKDPADALRSYGELETLIGRKGLIPPKEGDPDTVTAAWRAGLGVPEKPEGYEFKQPDGLPAEAWQESGLTAFRGWAHELGLTPAQAQGVAERFAKQQAEAMQRAALGIGPDGKPMEETLRAEWGVQYDAKVEQAKRAAKQFGAEAGVLDALEAKVGGAAMMQFFARIGEAIGEDNAAGMGAGGGAAGGGEKAELRRYFDATTAEHRAYSNPIDPKHREAVERVRALFAKGLTL